MQIRVAEIRDAEAIVAVINVAFRLAEGFLLDRDRALYSRPDAKSPVSFRGDVESLELIPA